MDKIPHREQMQHGIRVTVFDIPELAVREIRANAIIHQDFTASATARLWKFILIE